jgi:hypothetical protein
VIVDDGRAKREFYLNRDDEGLFVPSMIWRELRGFSEEAACLVLSSELYDESDYIRERNEFLGSVNIWKE